jgi:hypothetical protein
MRNQRKMRILGRLVWVTSSHRWAPRAVDMARSPQAAGLYAARL